MDGRGWLVVVLKYQVDTSSGHNKQCQGLWKWPPRVRIWHKPVAKGCAVPFVAKTPPASVTHSSRSSSEVGSNLLKEGLKSDWRGYIMSKNNQICKSDPLSPRSVAAVLLKAQIKHIVSEKWKENSIISCSGGNLGSTSAIKSSRPNSWQNYLVFKAPFFAIQGPNGEKWHACPRESPLESKSSAVRLSFRCI